NSKFPIPNSSVRSGLQMLAQQIAAEVAVEVAPHGVDVVPVVLRVVVLDEERRALDPVVVLLSALGLTRPGKRDLLDAGLAQARRSIGGDFRCHVAGVDVDEL